MTLVHSTEAYDVADFKVFPLLTDAAGGTSPTYGSPVDVPGIAAVNLDPQFVSAVLKGDNGKTLAIRSKIDRFQVSFTYDKIALDALAVMLGGVVVDKGSSRSGWGVPIGGSFPEFGAACSITDIATDEGLGALHVYWYKAVLTGGQILNAATEKFNQPTGQFDCFHCKSNIALDQFFEVLALEEPLVMVQPYIS